jgi:hypothetical protein
MRQHTLAYSGYLQQRSCSRSGCLAPPQRNTRTHTGVHSTASSIRQHTPAYVSTRQHTSAYVSIRQHPSATRIHYATHAHTLALLALRVQNTPAYVRMHVSIRQHTSAYVRIHVSIRQHTSARQRNCNANVPGGALTYADVC